MALLMISLASVSGAFSNRACQAGHHARVEFGACSKYCGVY